MHVRHASKTRPAERLGSPEGRTPKVFGIDPNKTWIQGGGKGHGGEKRDAVSCRHMSGVRKRVR